MNKDTILLVDDDEKILRILRLQLEHNDYCVITASNGEEALERLSEAKFVTLVLLDIMMPGIDGITLCREIKKRSSDIKIIIVSARDASKDVIRGLDSGADDYIKKPFIFDELLARIRANLRKTPNGESKSANLQFKDLFIDPHTFEVRRAGKLIELSKTEFDLLYYLMLNNKLVQSREQILDRVWGYNYYGSNNIVDVYIKYLRDKIDKDSSEKLIHTIRGRGYVIK